MSRAVRLVVWGSVLAWSTASFASSDFVGEQPKDIPLACDVDVVVAGDSTGAVEAACAAARHGARVFLAAPRPYLGTDICATLRLWLEEREQPTSKLAVACFGNERLTTPGKVKAEMDRALLDAGVFYLTGCYVTDVLRDGQGQLAGVVMVNRSGRQAVRAKVVVDATRQAAVARQAGVRFRPFAPGPMTFTRVVLGGDPQTGASVEKKAFAIDSLAKKSESPSQGQPAQPKDAGAAGRAPTQTPDPLPVYEYTIEVPMADNGVGSFCRAENLARDMTSTKDMEAASEVLCYRPADTIVGQRRLDCWPGAEQADLNAFRPEGAARLFVLGPYADLGSQAQAMLARSLEQMAVGSRIGRAAAEEAARLPAPGVVSLPKTDNGTETAAFVGEELRGIGHGKPATVHADRRLLPVLGRYDVVVVGGGTAGAPAGIGAAKSGAKTLVVEYLHELGGVGTVGLIAGYWYGMRGGFTEYIDRQVNPGKEVWNAVQKAEWLRGELTRLGADVWFDAMGCGALLDAGKVHGLVVATPQGRGVVLAAAVIDATGNSDVAACAGAATAYAFSDRGSLNVQIAGFPERPMRRSYVNTCYTMVDDTDVLDVWHLMVWKRTVAQKSPVFDMGQLIDSRERRRIVGDCTLTVPDILGRRTFPDTISHHYSNFDAAAFPDSPLLQIRSAKGPCFHVDMPYRCLLPRGLEGILVIGLGASADRDAMTLVRMQADLQNQGYAAGMAAAAAAKAGGATRSIDIKTLQARLVKEGVLEKRVLTDRDSYPMSNEDIARAVQALGHDDEGESLRALAVVMAHPKQAVPLLRSRYTQCSARPEQLHLATVLAAMGDSTGEGTLIAAINSHRQWDHGVALTSQRKTGNTFSDLDRLVIALGALRSSRAVEPLVEKLRQLTPDSELSHYKAIALALWDCRSPTVIEPLAGLLDQPGGGGQAPVGVWQQTAGEANAAKLPDRLVTVMDEKAANQGNLNKAFKQLIVASLLYRCGDRDGKAEAILKKYAQDIHGHFASHARRTLDDRPADSRK